MAMEFEDLVSGIGQAVARANRITEITSLSNYIESGYDITRPVGEYLNTMDGQGGRRTDEPHDGAARRIYEDGRDRELYGGHARRAYEAGERKESGMPDGHGSRPCGDSISPAVLRFRVGEKDMEVPVSALMHNTSMCLDEVDLTVRFRLFQRGGRLMAECGGEADDGDMVNEMKLHFKNVPSSESTARLNDQFVKRM